MSKKIEKILANYGSSVKPNDAAAILNTSRRTLGRLVEKNKLHPNKTPQGIRYNREELIQYMLGYDTYYHSGITKKYLFFLGCVTGILFWLAYIQNHL